MTSKNLFYIALFEDSNGVYMINGCNMLYSMDIGIIGIASMHDYLHVMVF